MEPTRVATPLRDGVELLADVYLPDRGLPQPAVLLRTPYDRALFPVEAAPLTAAGYAVVVQSVRGRHGSQGTWRPYLDEDADGYDSVEWVARQPWCDGNVGMIGASYSGWTQWAAARTRPPSLRTFVSSACCASWTGEWPWADGVLFAGAITWLHLFSGSGDTDLSACELDAPPWPLSRFQDRFPRPLQQAEDWLRHPRQDAFWSPLTLGPADFAAVDLPVLHVTGWFDGCQRGTQLLYDGMRRHSPAAARQRLLIGPWDHTLREMRRSYDGVDFGDDAVVDYAATRVAWFDRWLRPSEAVDPEPAVRAFVTGSNRWTDLTDLPPPDVTRSTWWLSADAGLRPRPGDPAGRVLRYDPTDPVPTRPAGSPAAHPELERTRVHQRADVLVWESHPLEHPLRIAGAPSAEVRVVTDVEDTDVFVEVVDVAPDGRRLLVSHGRRRARYRGTQEQRLVPGEPAFVPVDLLPRVHEVAAGHRLAVAVTSSGAPLWAPHPNRGGDLWDEEQPVVAITTVLGDSMLHLPVHE